MTDSLESLAPHRPRPGPPGPRSPGALSGRDGNTSRAELAVLVTVPAVKLLVHLATLRGYGIFRDELYYLASTDHLAWGYVDHPPLSIALLALVTGLLGDSLPVVRLVPALAGAAAVLVVGLTSRRLGAGAFGQAVSMVAMTAAPLYLALHHVYSMNALDLLIWALAAYLLLGALERPTLGRWAALGLLLGLGLQTKISVLWLGAGLAVGLAATRRGRRLLATPGPWVAGALAVLLFLPYVLWNAAHGWPTLEFMANATAFKMVARSPAAYLAELALVMNPLTLPIWAGGLWFLLAGAPTRGDGPDRSRRSAVRVLGWAAVTVLLILLLAGTAKVAYAAALLTWLFAAGGPAVEVALARLLEKKPRWRPASAGVLLVLLAVSGALLAPLALPVLPVEGFLSWSRTLGITPPAEEHHERGALPQFFADMHGWEELVAEVERVVGTLPPQERGRAVVFGQNYGEAGAVDVLGRDRGLPPAISGHNSYWLWGPPPGAEGKVVIVLGDDRESLEEIFQRVERAGTVVCTYCMPYEDHLPVWIARDLRGDLQELWPGVKSYN